MKFLRYKNYDSCGAFKMIKSIDDYRVAYPERWIPKGYGPRNYEYVFRLKSLEILHHRNPLDGTAVVIVRCVNLSYSSEINSDENMITSNIILIINMIIIHSTVKLFRVGDWSPKTGVDFTVVLNAAVFVVIGLLDDERIQRDGATLVLDCKGMGVPWLLRFISPIQIPVRIHIQVICLIYLYINMYKKNISYLSVVLLPDRFYILSDPEIV